jgi:hypothetical protein
MKKLIVMILAGMMVLSMAACENQPSEEASSESLTQNATQEESFYLSPNTMVALQRCYNNLKELGDAGMVICDDVVVFDAGSKSGEVVCAKVMYAEYEGVIEGTEIEISFDEYGLIDGIYVEGNPCFIGAREWYLSADAETRRKASEKFTCYNAAKVVSEMRSWKGYESTFLARNYLKN